MCLMLFFSNKSHLKWLLYVNRMCLSHVLRVYFAMALLFSDMSSYSYCVCHFRPLHIASPQLHFHSKLYQWESFHMPKLMSFAFEFDPTTTARIINNNNNKIECRIRILALGVIRNESKGMTHFRLSSIFHCLALHCIRCLILFLANIKQKSQ